MPKTLLLADDSVTIQKVVGISFANEDVVLLTVDNGDDAVARAREARPDLVLADVMMPGKDGYEVCETLKADPELRHVPVLLLSGTFEPFDEERAQRAGADGHITKPFEAQALVDQVNALLARAAEAPSAPGSAPDDATVMASDRDAAGPDAAFDFFDEEMAQTAPSPPGAAPALLDDAEEEPLELEAAVEDDEEIAPALRAGDDDLFGSSHPGDSQATVLYDEAPGAPAGRPLLGDGFDADELAVPEIAPARAHESASAPRGYEESFDFGFGDEPVVAPPLARAGVAEAAVEPLPADFEEPIAAPAAALPGEDASAPFADPTPPPLPDPVPPPIPASATAAPVPLTVPVSAAERAHALSEPIQRQLQETLEKIVWEAFGDLTERIVREVIERVEAVAWEAIPQMAETLIREEIRRLRETEEA